MNPIAYLTALFTLTSIPAWASFTEVVICNPKDQSLSLEVHIKSNNLITIWHNKDEKDIRTAKITQIIPSSLEELHGIAEDNDMHVDLIEGTTYATNDTVIFLAKDKWGTDYYFNLMGPTVFLVGSSESCK